MEPMTHLLSVYGIAGLTAYFGLLHVGKPKEGETVVVSAAAGSVGSIVGQIAKIKGCHVIGIAGGKDKCHWLTSANSASTPRSITRTARPTRRCARRRPRASTSISTMSAATFSKPVIALMNNRGRIACCGAISQYDGVPSAHGPRGVPGLIVVKRLIMQGFIVMDYMDQSAAGAGRPAVLGRLRQIEGAGRRDRRDREHAESADRPARRREPRQADGEGVGLNSMLRTPAPSRTSGPMRRAFILRDASDAAPHDEVRRHRRMGTMRSAHLPQRRAMTVRCV